MNRGAIALAAVFIAALVANVRMAGTSPIAWIDTFSDETEVQTCLTDDVCSLSGVGTSIPGQVHGVAWLEMRTLLAWLGAGLDGTHVVMQVLSALAAVLVFALAAQLGGRLAGALAVWILVLEIGTNSVRVTALYNSIPLLFLGAVFAVACTAAVEQPGAVSVSLAALVGAVMANVHLACILTGASVVWVALLARGRRLRLAALGAALFAVATFAIAPPSWLHNAANLLQPHAPVGRGAGMSWPRDELMPWALFAMIAWATSFVSAADAWAAYRRRSQGVLAVMAPFVAAFLVAPAFGLDANAKYLAHVKGACAVAAALPIALAARARLRTASGGRLLPQIERALPYAVACFIAVTPQWSSANDERTPTIADLAAVRRILQGDLGWDAVHLLAGLKTPYGPPVLNGLRQLADMDTAVGSGDSEGRALLLIMAADDVPRPLPSNWRVVRQSARAATVLVLTQSQIDWTMFEVCSAPADGVESLTCAESGLHLDEKQPFFQVPNMPPNSLGRGTLRLRLRLHPSAPGTAFEIFMPRMHDVCGGRIAGVSGEGLVVDADGRRLTLSPGAAAAEPATVDVEWHIGSPECPAQTYQGQPPFFVEGDAAAVQALAAALRKREA